MRNTTATTAPPLQGVTVLDLTRALAGPYCTMLLADLGARVVKIEPPDDGDTTRLLPPILMPQISSYFVSVNRNKQGLTINLKNQAGIALFRELAAKADVVIDNFRPGTMQRLGIEYDELRANVNPRLVSCSINGFGAEGRYASRSSYDLVVQAMAGSMSVTGEVGGRPVRLGLPMGDLGSGMFAGFGICAALHARGADGPGRHVEVSMLDAMVSLLSYMGGDYLQTGRSPGPQGSGHQVNVPYQAFETKTAWIVIAIFGEKYWAELCEVMGLPEMIADPRYAKASARSLRRDEVLGILVPRLKSRPAEEWLPEMLAKKIPCGPINSVGEIMNDPAIQERHMIVEMVHPQYGPVRAPGNPMKVDGINDGVATAAPLPGEDTEAILNEFLGYQAATIQKLQSEGAI